MVREYEIKSSLKILVQTADTEHNRNAVGTFGDTCTDGQYTQHRDSSLFHLGQRSGEISTKHQTRNFDKAANHI
jgi:hypothetical protein